jgi:hypothetical protein
VKTCDRCKLGCLKRYAVDFVQTQFKHKKHFVCWRCLNWLEILYSSVMELDEELTYDEEKERIKFAKKGGRG